MSKKINPTIWMYWDRGLDQAPELVRICVESWRRRNPEWTVRVLDDRTLPHWVDMTDVQNHNPRLTIQAYADILRWRLLAAYGGIWADATLYCAMPLNGWINGALNGSNLFVFRCPEVYLFHSWFIATSGRSFIINEMHRELNYFFLKFGGFRHYWDLRGIWRFYWFLEKHSGKFNYRLWRSWFFRRFLKASPYFFQNYILGYLVSHSKKAADEFCSIMNDYGECPNALQFMTARNRPPQLKDVRRLLDGPCTVQKLTNKRFVEEWTAGGVLELLDRHGR